MNRQQLLKHILHSVQQDARDYPRLQQHLETQFTATLTHDSERLQACAAVITELCEQLDTRRRQRLQWIAQVLPQGQVASIPAVLALLPRVLRAPCQQCWQSVLDTAVQCRELNLRNGQLLQQHHAMLRRIFEGEMHVYTE